MTGPAQAGKSLAGFVIPTLYHLFEVGETVLCCVPDSDMVEDKWSVDLLPAIQRSRYRDLLPTRGEGSRGGRVERGVRFANNAELRFMTGGESVGGVSGFTTRVVVVTEVNKFQAETEGSQEADRIELFLARCQAFGDRAQIYLECTNTTTDGRIWVEYEGGSASRLLLPCPHCGAWVFPDREQLVGWQGAKSDVEAELGARLACTECGVLWTDGERRAAAAKCRLAHRGQTIDRDGRLSGDPPKTRTLGFRFTATVNMLVSLGWLATKEHAALADPRPDSAERDLCHNKWGRPTSVGESRTDGIDANEFAQRTLDTGRGRVPAWADFVTVGVDVGKRLLHWTAVGWSIDGTSHIVDYGRIEVASDDLGEEKAVEIALNDGLEQWGRGWPGGRDRDATPQQVVIDSGYQTPTVYGVVAAAKIPTMASKGYGSGQQERMTYPEPRAISASVRRIGDRWHIARLKSTRSTLLEFSADRWKDFVYARATTPVGKSGALTIWRSADPNEHRTFARHMAAESKANEWDPRRGEVTKWVANSANNHFFDAAVLAAVGASVLGVRVEATAAPQRGDRSRGQWFGGSGGNPAAKRQQPASSGSWSFGNPAATARGRR